MSYNTEMIKKSLSEITLDTFKEAIFIAYRDGIKSLAPLGCSGDTVLLFSKDGSRKSSVSIRNYSGDAELLITDAAGGFLFYGRFDVNIGLNFMASQYLAIFESVKDKIETVVQKTIDFENVRFADDCEKTVGFEMLRAFQNLPI